MCVEVYASNCAFPFHAGFQSSVSWKKKNHLRCVHPISRCLMKEIKNIECFHSLAIPRNSCETRG